MTCGDVLLLDANSKEVSRWQWEMILTGNSEEEFGRLRLQLTPQVQKE